MFTVGISVPVFFMLLYIWKIYIQKQALEQQCLKNKLWIQAYSLEMKNFTMGITMTNLSLGSLQTLGTHFTMTAQNCKRITNRLNHQQKFVLYTQLSLVINNILLQIYQRHILQKQSLDLFNVLLLNNGKKFLLNFKNKINNDEENQLNYNENYKEDDNRQENQKLSVEKKGKQNRKTNQEIEKEQKEKQKKQREEQKIQMEDGLQSFELLIKEETKKIQEKKKETRFQSILKKILVEFIVNNQQHQVKSNYINRIQISEEIQMNKKAYELVQQYTVERQELLEQFQLNLQKSFEEKSALFLTITANAIKEAQKYEINQSQNTYDPQINQSQKGKTKNTNQCKFILKNIINYFIICDIRYSKNEFKFFMFYYFIQNSYQFLYQQIFHEQLNHNFFSLLYQRNFQYLSLNFRRIQSQDFFIESFYCKCLYHKSIFQNYEISQLIFHSKSNQLEIKITFFYKAFKVYVNNIIHFIYSKISSNPFSF
ncbi:unnamed protein product [Paramecium sonneborni]|uniref:Uncharacterized protein n=1 Tax=Paramecium sonneborni TaxID=65129 RepID=A0A8S1RLB9_9CILI|nr:unnamed protein product [Paramecium sonneborni]